MADSRKRRNMTNTGDTSGNKKFLSGTMSGHRFLIPSKAAGAMIGKGGEVIKRLRTEHNARIIVPDSQGPERLLIIDASPSIILDIWNDILPSIKEYMNAKDCDYKGSSSKFIEGENEIDLRLIVHESQAGAVIGKGGERIRNLIDKQRMTMIKLYQTFCPNSTDRIVRMVSRIENVLACLENVFELLENQSIKGERKDYNPDNYDEAAAPNYGGFVSKDSRFPSGRRQSNPPGRSLIDNTFESTDYLLRPSVFSRVNSNKLEDGINAVRSIFNPPNPMMEYERGVSDLFGGVIRMGAIQDINAMNLSRIAVPKNLVSAITGRECRRLRDLERDSGANIDIDADRMGSRETLFVLRGNPDQIYKAQCLMQLCARKFADDAAVY